MLTTDEKDAVRQLVRHYLNDDEKHNEFWWNFGSEVSSDQLPWAEDWDRASYLFGLAIRTERIVRARR